MTVFSSKKNSSQPSQQVRFLIVNFIAAFRSTRPLFFTTHQKEVRTRFFKSALAKYICMYATHCVIENTLCTVSKNPKKSAIKNNCTFCLKG